uniref:Uncharacterized protein n=1 Tax=Timema genevievae TaxID=629358 RepID=A0A7R9K4F8_TIMGE|nr:unnamed protein product [Timema genevievae]
MMWPQQTKGWTYDAASGREGEDVYYGLRKGGRTYDVASGKKGRIHALALGREGEDVCHGLRKGGEDVCCGLRKGGEDVCRGLRKGRGCMSWPQEGERMYVVASGREEDLCRGLRNESGGCMTWPQEGKGKTSALASGRRGEDVEKQPEEFDEDDLRVVMEYEEKVKFLMSERERYKKMLDQERIKLTTARDLSERIREEKYCRELEVKLSERIREESCCQELEVKLSERICEERYCGELEVNSLFMTVIECRKSVRKFNSRLADLYQNKLKVDSAINEELLKILRARQLCYKRALLDKKEQNYMSMIGEKEGIIENLQDDIQKLQKLSSECRGAYESQVNRDKSLEKNFKKDFPDMPALVLEQLSKMYKKRPKMHQRIQTSVALVSELSRCSVSGEKPIFLLAECLDYLKGLDNLDSFSNASPNTSEEIWAILCRVRRLKVESELKMKALSLEVTEADATVNVFQKKMIKNKEMLTSLQGELRVVRNEKLNLIHNLQIQLVMKQGLVEISIQGSISDFDDAILINRVCVDRMNETIKKAGQRKLRTMHETTNFRRGILCKEWEHKKLRMEIEDLKEHLHTLEGIKVTKDIQMYLRRQAQGLPQDKTTSLEKELQLLREVRMCVHTSCNHLHRHGGS